MIIPETAPFRQQHPQARHTACRIRSCGIVSYSCPKCTRVRHCSGRPVRSPHEAQQLVEIWVCGRIVSRGMPLIKMVLEWAIWSALSLVSLKAIFTPLGAHSARSRSIARASSPPVSPHRRQVAPVTSRCCHSMRIVCIVSPPHGYFLSQARASAFDGTLPTHLI